MALSGLFATDPARTAGFAFAAWLALASCACAAANEVYTGQLVPESFDRPIPVVVEFRNSAGRLFGNVKTSSPLTSSPLTSSGERLLGEKIGDECKIESDLGHGLAIGMNGTCNEHEYRGKYYLFMRDRQLHQGTFGLNRLKPEESKKLTEAERHSLISASNTACLRNNSTCLAACPRDGDYNAQFLCANGCRRKLVTCRANTKKLLERASSPAPE